MQIDRSGNNCFTEKKNIFFGPPNPDVVSKSITGINPRFAGKDQLIDISRAHSALPPEPEEGETDITIITPFQSFSQ